jgi:hypothetical protein
VRLRGVYDSEERLGHFFSGVERGPGFNVGGRCYVALGGSDCIRDGIRHSEHAIRRVWVRRSNWEEVGRWKWKETWEWVIGDNGPMVTSDKKHQANVTPSPSPFTTAT